MRFVIVCAVLLTSVLAQAQTITRRTAGATGELADSVQVARLIAIAGECWVWPVAGLRSVQVGRRDSDIVLTGGGRRQLTRAEAQAHVAAGGQLYRDRWVEAGVTCTLTGSRLTALDAMLRGTARRDGVDAAMLAGGASSLYRAAWVRDAVFTPWRALYVVGQQSLTPAAAVTAAEAGEDIEPAEVLR